MATEDDYSTSRIEIDAVPLWSRRDFHDGMEQLKEVLRWQ
jgi:hypothetical protein